ncbi:MAG: cytochrome c3 family protein [Phycisphaerales bacterium]
MITARNAITRLATKARARPRSVVSGVLCIAVVLGAWRLLRSEVVPPRLSETTVRAASAAPAPRPTRVVAMSEGCSTASCHPALADHGRPGHSACGACHGPDVGGHRYPLAGAPADLCIGCHETGRVHPFPHNAVAEEGCLACHSPHAQGGRGLLARGTTAATCEQCHPRVRGAVTHRPFEDGDCEECHNPHGSMIPGLLRQATLAENCGLCHGGVVERMADARSSHGAVDGSCGGCHDPHVSTEKKLLTLPLREGCVRCHTETGADALVKGHPMTSDGRCDRCHDPHASDHAAMLRAPTERVCLDCHAREITGANGKSLAPLPVAQLASAGSAHSDCASCHSLHAGAGDHLLSARSEGVPLGPYDAANHALCFGCHDSAMADPNGPTRFMNGGVNLHAAHLRRGERSGSCVNCHAVHTSGEPRMIAAKVRFQGSEWSMPLGFELTVDGGRCATSCHEPLAYSRGVGAANGGVK